MEGRSLRTRIRIKLLEGQFEVIAITIEASGVPLGLSGSSVSIGRVWAVCHMLTRALILG